MLPVSDWEIEQIRADIEGLLPETCALLSPTETRGTDGGVLVTWGTAAASVKCRFDALNGSEQTAAGGAQAFHGYTVTLPATTTVTERYRVVKGGVTYNVITVDPGKSWPGCVHVLVERV